MKKTEYFSAQVVWNQSREGIKDVVAQRDAFLEKNKDFIGKIDNESIIVEYMQGTNQTLYIIKLSYFEK